jgi:hypothetical protein
MCCARLLIAAFRRDIMTETTMKEFEATLVQISANLPHPPSVSDMLLTAGSPSFLEQMDEYEACIRPGPCPSQLLW